MCGAISTVAYTARRARSCLQLASYLWFYCSTSNSVVVLLCRIQWNIELNGWYKVTQRTEFYEAKMMILANDPISQEAASKR